MTNGKTTLIQNGSKKKLCPATDNMFTYDVENPDYMDKTRNLLFVYMPLTFTRKNKKDATKEKEEKMTCYI